MSDIDYAAAKVWAEFFQHEANAYPGTPNAARALLALLAEREKFHMILAHGLPLLAENARLRAALEDACAAAHGAPKGSIGSIDSHYIMQVAVGRVAGWAAVLHPEVTP